MPIRPLTAVVLGCLVVGLTGMTVRTADPADDHEAVYVLDRLGFGPTTADLEHVEAIGIDRYIAEQLDPQKISEPPALTQRLAAFETLRLDPAQLFEMYWPHVGEDGVRPSVEERRAVLRRAQIIVQEAAEARILRAVMSHRQLQEVMVDFWYNHFNVFARKGPDRLWVGAYEEEAIRPYVLGKFRDLLLATARHPAMLFYLDSVKDKAPGRGPSGKELGLNENYAREVMELHTLGVDGGYTQADVTTLARILTGWGLDRVNMLRGTGNGFRFEPRHHDFGPKMFLGHQIRSQGEMEGVEALDLLARSPATARHIAFELAQYFVADTPPADLVDRLAARFRATDGDIRAVLQTLFASREFRDAAEAKYKTPYQFVISAARAAGLSVSNPHPLLAEMTQLGMPLYGCLTPDGYKNTKAAWLNPDATMQRIDFATTLAGATPPIGESPRSATGATRLAATPAAMLVAAGGAVDPVHLEGVLGSSLSARTRAAVAAAPAELRAAMILGSPDFMQR